MANRCAHRKTPNKMFEQTCHTRFRASEHPEKKSNNKKVLYIIRKNGFRLLLSVAVKMVGACMACIIFKKVKKRKSHSSNHVMTFFFDTPVGLFLIVNQAMSIGAKWICNDDAKCHDCSQSTRLRSLPRAYGIIFMLSCWIYLMLHNLKNWSAV